MNDVGARLIGLVIAFIAMQVLFWPVLDKAVEALRSKLRSRNPREHALNGTGRVIYVARSVDDRLGDIASQAISEDRFKPYRQVGPEAVIVLRTEPPYVASIRFEPAIPGARAALIVTNVADPYPQSVHEVAEIMSEFWSSNFL